MKSFTITPRPRRFSLAYLTISDTDSFANTETRPWKENPALENWFGHLKPFGKETWRNLLKAETQVWAKWMKGRTQGTHRAFSFQSTYFVFSFNSISSFSAPGPLSSPLGSRALCLPSSPELFGMVGYNDLLERYTGSISVLTIVYSKVTAIREIRGVKQKFRKDEKQWESEGPPQNKAQDFPARWDSLNPAFYHCKVSPRHLFLWLFSPGALSIGSSHFLGLP